MKKRRGFFHFTGISSMTMQKKLIIVFVVLIIIPISATGFISYQNYIQSINKNTKNYVTELISNMQTNLDNHLEDMMTVSKIPLYSVSMQQYLSHQEMTLEKQRQMDFYIGLLDSMRKDLYSAYIYDNFGNVFYRIKSDAIREDMMSQYEKWKELAIEGNGDPVIIPTQRVVRANGSPQYLFTVLRSIRDIGTLENIGFVAVDADISIIENVVQELNTVTNGKTLIIDGENNVAYDSDHILTASNITGNEVVEKAIGDQGSFNIVVDHISYICTYSVSKDTGWKIFAFIPVNYLHHDAQLTRNVTLTTTIGIIGFALLVSVVLSFMMTRSLRQMTDLMRSVRGGNMDVSFDVKQKDEVGILGMEFNRMLRRMKELISEIYVIQSRKKEADLEALQSQINPHFIYNTLETIRMTAEINDDEEVAEMTFTLGKLLRYSINRGRETVELREEMQHLERYLQLLRYRFNNRFNMTFEIPQELLNFPVMKLTFQPIVENAIIHGVEGKPNEVSIRLSAEMKEQLIIFSIKDEGAGMDGVTLDLLRQSMNGTRDAGGSKTGVGLRNVNERIKLHYGEMYGLEIESKWGEGTTVYLKLPRRQGD
ncbi:sensor histidine kinase [Paenibacillus lupini]|uniref:cache domain-containing sensor histidine kinase n=1 Tax=Paenibacillus lupini TaxID=1450204 RepID=UPI00141EDCE5|nr:sensor histidine kinase [Paenibacillus lupini]NIK23306.1 two-component system sensor histidine kinase YesM [Paenibacillus lupini]